jgi:anthranilate phosphoribosyltransferase
MQFKDYLNKIIGGNDLSTEEMTSVMDQLMEGELTQAQIGGLLTALRMKGESIGEISAAALSMRRHATQIDAGPPPIVDTCGTGGDGSGTYNISTTAAFIAAGAGVKIAKHGNRAASSKCGSADVLEALGVNIDVSPEQVGKCVREVGIGFLFARSLHGAMKHVGGPRVELGTRTIFNMLGPLTNPASATAQVIGVFDGALTERFAHVLHSMGSERAMIVHGSDHLDEITLTGPTRVSELKDGAVTTYDFEPQEIVGSLCTLNDLKGGEIEENAAITRDILDGAEGPPATVAKLNAAAAIYVGGLAPDLAAAYAVAGEAITSGDAKQKLADLVAATN